MRGSSDDAKVHELPRVLAVEIFGEQTLAPVERGPVTVDPDYFAEIGACDVEDALEIHFLRLDNTLARMLERPDDAGEHRRGDLERGGVVVRCRPPRLGDCQARAGPINA